jgi:hypothetical protein
LIIEYSSHRALLEAGRGMRHVACMVDSRESESIRILNP